MSGTPLRVALYSGVIFEGDAISNSLLLKLRLVERLIEQGWDLTVTAFCLGTDVADPNIRAVLSAPSLLAEPAFQSADLHIFEFGIYYELFDVLPFISPEKAIAVVYHNVTPVELLDSPEALAAIERTRQQKYNLTWADRVICDSDTNCDDLVAIGLPPERMTTLPLPPWVSRPSPPRSSRPADQPVELVFVGRPVRAKGLLDLLAASRRMVDDGITAFRVRIVSRMAFAEENVIGAVREAAASDELREIVLPDWDVPNERMAAVFERADALVIPSYHEGYCVPVVEAYGSQCHVISYDNSNFPAVGAGLSELVPTGDIAALADAMRRFVVDLGEARATSKPFVVTTSGGPCAEADWRDRAVGLALDLRGRFEVELSHLLLEAMQLVRSPVSSEKFGVGA